MGRKKILVLDDSKTSLLMESMLLKRSQFDVVTANDGQEAVEVALAERPDAIVMDVVMPRMTGLEACCALRRREETGRLGRRRALPAERCLGLLRTCDPHPSHST